jgi:hypothetical protein
MLGHSTWPTETNKNAKSKTVNCHSIGSKVTFRAQGQKENHNLILHILALDTNNSIIANSISMANNSATWDI